MKLSDLTWLEITHVFADLAGANVKLGYSPDFSYVSVETVWKPEENPSMVMASGLGCGGETADDACKAYLMRVFSNCESFPGRCGLKIPRLSFSSKEELELGLAAAGMDVQFMLGHRYG